MRRRPRVQRAAPVPPWSARRPVPPGAVYATEGIVRAEAPQARCAAFRPGQPGGGDCPWTGRGGGEGRGDGEGRWEGRWGGEMSRGAFGCDASAGPPDRGPGARRGGGQGPTRAQILLRLPPASGAAPAIRRRGRACPSDLPAAHLAAAAPCSRHYSFPIRRRRLRRRWWRWRWRWRRRQMPVDSSAAYTNGACECTGDRCRPWNWLQKCGKALGQWRDVWRGGCGKALSRILRSVTQRENRGEGWRGEGGMGDARRGAARPHPRPTAARCPLWGALQGVR